MLQMLRPTLNMSDELGLEYCLTMSLSRLLTIHSLKIIIIAITSASQSLL